MEDVYSSEIFHDEFECAECDYKASTETEIMDHSEMHISEEDDMNNQCTYCEKSFSKNSTLIMHERTHTGGKPYHCSHCDMSFPGNTQLKSHTRSRRHINEKNLKKIYKCKYCDMSFSVSYNLIQHTRKHKEKNTYKCKHCNKTISNKSNLERHEKIQNREKNCRIEKPYKCKHCNITFSQVMNLENPEKLHTRGEMFQCNHCNMLFSFKAHLINHMENKHKSRTSEAFVYCKQDGSERIFTCKQYTIKSNEQCCTDNFNEPKIEIKEEPIESENLEHDYLNDQLFKEELFDTKECSNNILTE